MLTALTDLLDLALGRACSHCAEPGRVLCSSCLEPLRRLGVRLPASAAHPAGRAAAPYDGKVRRLVIDYKEEGNRALAPMLGVLLADAIAASMADLAAAHACLVRVPGHRRPARGFDALGVLLGHALRSLRHRAVPVTVVPALRVAHGYPALKGQSRSARAAVIAGAFSPTAAARHVRRPVLVVDDVLTTGVTVGEAVRALAAVHVPVDAIAVLSTRL